MKIVALAGGVGGAKLAHGLSLALAPEDLTVIVNTGDDFEQFGLRISPDLDTVCYTLAGLANPRTGWGLKDETWQVLTQLKQLGAPDWFKLGDRDLATHLERTRLIREGMRLSQVTQRFCEHWGVKQQVFPMTDSEVSTELLTSDGTWLDFQEYFVKQACEPQIVDVHFKGASSALPAHGILDALEQADAVVICPSNPYLSILPILAIPGMYANLIQKKIIAVSPIINGQAVKGPLAKMIQDLTGSVADATFAAGFYRERFDLAGYLMDDQDSSLVSSVRAWGIICDTCDTMMPGEADRLRVANKVLSLAEACSARTENL
jgi:LPPG:FO 2-phospho-L-lactate transferase